MTTGTTFRLRSTAAQILRRIALLACCCTGISTGALAQVQNTNTGTNSLFSNTTGSYNSAFGYESLYSNTTGNSNSALGAQALRSSTTGNYNSAFGHFSLFANTTGDNNSAYGHRTLISNSTGDDNCAFGYNALPANTTGLKNCAFGSQALISSTQGAENVAVGYYALLSNDTGNYNTAVGAQSLQHNVSGECNVAVGSGAGPGLGSDNLSNSIAIGCNAIVSADNTTVIGNSSMTSIGGYAGWSNLSDGRFKNNVRENVPGISFIKKLRPVTYTYNLRSFDAFSGLDDNTTTPRYAAARKAKESIVYTGFIAQEVEKAAEELNFNFSGVDKPSNDKKAYGLRYAEFVVPIVQAIQEQQETIETQQNVIEQQKSEIAAIRQQHGSEISALQQRIERLERLLLSQEKTGAGSIETGDNSSLHVYPNPTDGMVKVSLNNKARQLVALQIADVKGTVIQNRTSSDAAINTTFDLAGYPAGNYMLTVTQGSQTMTKVIIFGGK